jgi:uncharacterized membrane-anchored protein
MNVRLYVWQRLTAAIMAPLVLAHIVVIFYATRKGLSAADILARTRGSFAWASFYGACMSSEHFGQLAWQFKRMSGSSGLKVQAAIAC